jgi:hypothetical protein
MKFLKLLNALFVLLPLASFAQNNQHLPSKERVKFEEIRATNIDANLVRTTVFNYGLTGRLTANPQQTPFEWPKNTRQHYLAASVVSYGAEVLHNGQPLRLFMPTIARSDPADGSKDWELMPVSGYLNPAAGAQSQIANRLNPNSWPPVWPDKMDDPNDPGWPGSFSALFGKNAFNADQEIVYKLGDDRYDRFDYAPDLTDPTRRGIGMLTETRVLEWSQVLIQDVVFVLHFFQNDGSFDLRRTGVNISLFDLVGGDGDSSDDIAFYDLVNDVAWSTDADGIGNAAFGSNPVGVVATSYLETPGNEVDRIDNDVDGEDLSPVVQASWLVGEIPNNGIDDNGNGLIDENQSHIPFVTPAGSNPGNAMADYIDNNGDSEAGGPVVTQAMIAEASVDRWRRWPPNPENDPFQAGLIHLLDVGPDDLGRRYKDNIDNDGNAIGAPVVTEEMIAQAGQDRYRRYRVPGTNVILYDLGPDDLGKKYIDRDGLRDPGIDEGIDEMIDESRSDGIDNDGDWNASIDDVGLDGQPGTGDFGENDGQPTSGAGTSLPGEPNIDKTDVSESDQIGLTNVQYQSSGILGSNYSNDNAFFNNFLTPGEFYDGSALSGDFNLFVGSGLFPMKSGAIERISMAVCLGADTTDALLNRDAAQVTYDSDYQFASAPFVPTLTAVPGDGKVTLYWDDYAERSFDRFLSRLINQPDSPYQGLYTPYDFEGYRIYRATDAGLLDPFIVTDASGTLTLRKPLVQFDLVDQFSGLHPVDVNGAHFDLGRNTGITHSWVDNNVTNGQRYFYVITAYDFGLVDRDEPNKGIFPSESPFSLSVDEVGDFLFGPNVAIVTPNAPVAGYQRSMIENDEVEHIKGSSFSRVFFNLVDRIAIRDRQRYLVTFEDTTKVTPGREDTVRTKNYSLFRVPSSRYSALDQLRGKASDAPDFVSFLEGEILSASDTLVFRGNHNTSAAQKLVHDGFYLSFVNVPQVTVDYTRLGWTRNADQIHQGDMYIFRSGFAQGTKVPFDYQIIVGAPGRDTSAAVTLAGTPLPARPVNFSVYNVTKKSFIDFAFLDFDNTGTTAASALLSRVRQNRDRIIFLENIKGRQVATWEVSFAPTFVSTRRNPQAGDTLALFTEKPFLGYQSGLGDIYEFTTVAERADETLAKSALSKIRVVPNPYVVAATWEPRNPFSSGRGPREIHFNHLPAKCTIRILNVAGELVRKLEVDNPVGDGTAKWDLLTKDNLAASYGVYIYHIEAPGVGEHVGKFAIIK